MAEPAPEAVAEAAALRAALRRFLRQREAVTRRHGLAPRHYELLLMIKASDGGRSTVSELVELLQLTQSTVTELVQRAEEAGLVTREPSPTDGRIVLLALTDEAERRVADAVSDLGPERTRLLVMLRNGD
jgi:DNA-binding MarR family transcriptional regulator